MPTDEGSTGETTDPAKSPDGLMAKAVSTGDRRAILTAAMGALGTAIDTAGTGQVASLVKQLSDLSRQIDEMGPAAGTEDVDDLARRVAEARDAAGQPDAEAPDGADDGAGEPGAPD